MKVTAPCKNCQRDAKKVGCHASCKEYISWKKKLDEMNLTIERNRKNYAIWDTKTMNRIQKVKPTNRKRSKYG